MDLQTDLGLIMIIYLGCNWAYLSVILQFVLFIQSTHTLLQHNIIAF